MRCKRVPACLAYTHQTQKTKIDTKLFAAIKQRSSQSKGRRNRKWSGRTLNAGEKMSQATYAAPGISSISASDPLYSKIAWRIMPILLFGYIIAYLDRVNVGFAKLQMMGALQFSDSVYGLGAGIFFLGYFLFEIPSNLILHKVGVRV